MPTMAVAALATCAIFATASGIIGAVVTLMGLLAFPAMVKANYNRGFAAGVICAGGTLGILIPPSIMLIVYAAIAELSPLRLYAAAIVPGFLLAGFYMIYVVGYAFFRPSIAPKPVEEEIPPTGSAFVLLAKTCIFCFRAPRTAEHHAVSLLRGRGSVIKMCVVPM